MINQSQDKKALIHLLDDDAIFTEDISDILVRNGYMVESFNDPMQLLIKIKTAPPDLILLDINLNRTIDGIDLAHIIKRQFDIPFIFLSGYEEKNLLLRLEGVNPAFFMTKPLNEREILFNIAIILNKKLNALQQELSTDTQKTEQKYLMVKRGNQYEKINLEEIDYIEADGNYSLIMITGRKFSSSLTMKKIENQVSGDILVRIHRKYIVNINRISTYSRSFVILNSLRLPIGLKYKSGLEKRFLHI